MKLFKKSGHCLFVEEERYKWAEPSSSTHRKLVYLSLLIVTAGLLFSAVN